jgi:dynein light intermediate chain
MGGYNRGIANMESRPSIEDILNAILPPREWDDSGKHYIQFVSHNKASRDDVSNLQKKLD